MKSPARINPVFTPLRAATGERGNALVSLREAPTREDGVSVEVRARAALAVRKLPLAPIPTPTAAHPPSPVGIGEAIPNPRRVAAPSLSCVSTAITHHDADSDHQTLEGTVLSNVKRILNVRGSEPYRRRREVEKACRYIAREAVSDAPVKVVAIEAGISPREVTHLRTATRNPRLDVWFALLQRRPDLKPLVDEITSGQATSEQIAKLIAFFQQSGGP